MVGLAYLVAAYLVQGAFKETMRGALRARLRDRARRARARATASRAVRVAAALPLAVLAIGSVYTYSFPGLLWLGGAFGVWAALELGSPGAAAARRRARPRPASRCRRPLPPSPPRRSRSRPRLGRMVDFANFETFNPAGAGLGNLFNRLSPLEALGIWPSGDFRVEPGDGAIPALVFYVGGGARAGGARLRALVVAAPRRARGAGGARGAALWLYALLGGTPYQEAKALV